MPIALGTYTLGPHNAELLVNTRRSGAAARAGHDLVIEVTAWNATLALGDSPGSGSLALSADPGALRVREGRGGITALDDDDKENIRQTIDEEVLKGGAIEFRSTEIELDSGGERLWVWGVLELGNVAAPISFQLADDPPGHLTGSATVTQGDWGIKPYSALFGALKVADEVQVTVDARLGD